MKDSTKPPSRSTHEPGESAPPWSGFWFRLPAEIEKLRGLSNAQLRCYLVAQRAIQRDRNAGKLSVSQVSRQAGLSKNHTCGALNDLVAKGWLIAEKSGGKTTVYHSPIKWKATGNRTPTGERLDSDYTPTGERFKGDYTPTGERHHPPTGERNRTPTGETHSESLESSEKEPPKPPKGADTSAPQSTNQKKPDALADLIQEIAEGIHKRHPNRSRIIPVSKIVKKLTTISKLYAAKERLAKLRDLEDSHREWSDSEDWTKNGCQYCKGIAPWLNPSNRLWENRPQVAMREPLFEEESEPEPREPAEPPPPVKIVECERCGDSGAIDLQPGKTTSRVKWCDCKAAEHLRETQPDYVTTFNESQKKFEERYPAKGAA